MSFDYCVMLVPPVEGRTRGAALADATWAPDTRLRIGFMDGDRSLQDRVLAAAEQWLTQTGIRLSFERSNDLAKADIRISFERSGSWSFIGRYAHHVPKDEPTMNYGWLKPDSSDLEIQEVVLHEFGHALGFVHEHQNPEGGMNWDRDTVIEALSAPPNSWKVDRIERNVLDPYDRDQLIATPFDPDSIMLYPFPAEWTTDGRSTKNNTTLSPKDIELARRIYLG